MAVIELFKKKEVHKCLAQWFNWYQQQDTLCLNGPDINC